MKNRRSLSLTFFIVIIILIVFQLVMESNERFTARIGDLILDSEEHQCFNVSIEKGTKMIKKEFLFLEAGGQFCYVKSSTQENIHFSRGDEIMGVLENSDNKFATGILVKSLNGQKVNAKLIPDL